jgi:spore germination protein YaaH
MAYDFHYPNSDRAGPVAPINKVEDYTSYDINQMLKDYLKTIPPNKIILGVPYYGYNWVVESQTPYALRIPGDDYVGYSISQTYEDVAETILEINPEILWDESAKVPYFTYVSPTNGSYRMVYFENPDSLREKYKLVNSNNLGGVGIWALGYDGGYQELWNLLEKEFILK